MRTGGVADVLVVAALVFAILLTATTIWRLPGLDLGGRMGPARWDPRESWASTLSAVGTILGTVLSSTAVSPTETLILSKREFVALSVLFGALTVFAPFIYNATRWRATASHATGDELPDYVGSVWSFLGASVTILWAVSGQLATLFLLIRELRLQGSLSVLVGFVFQAVLVVAFVGLMPYAWRSIRVALVRRNPQGAAFTSDRTAQGWSLL